MQRGMTLRFAWFADIPFSFSYFICGASPFLFLFIFLISIELFLLQTRNTIQCLNPWEGLPIQLILFTSTHHRYSQIVHRAFRLLHMSQPFNIHVLFATTKSRALLDYSSILGSALLLHQFGVSSGSKIFQVLICLPFLCYAYYPFQTFNSIGFGQCLHIYQVGSTF